MVPERGDIFLGEVTAESRTLENLDCCKTSQKEETRLILIMAL